MVIHLFQEALECGAVVKVFARMKLITYVYAGLIKGVQNRFPALAQFSEAGFHQTSRALGPRVHERPQQGAGERGVSGQAEVLTGFSGQQQLVNGPLLPCVWIVVDRKSVVEGK